MDQEITPTNPVLFFMGRGLLFCGMSKKSKDIKNPPTLKPNRDIEQWLLNSGEWHINIEWGLQQFYNYLHEVHLVSQGIPYSEMGIGERRANEKPAILNVEGSALITAADLSNSDETPPGSFAHLKLQGVMRSRGGMSHQGVDSLVNQIRMANSNPNIEGIILEVDTGGGESSAGDKLQAAVRGSDKPVVVWGHLVASAGISGTLYAAEIIASSKASQFGSIGTYVTTWKGFADWYNRNFQDFYADKSYNKNKTFRELLAGNTEPLKSEINKSNQMFLEEVKKARSLKGDIDNTLSGEMFYAHAARRRGLVDGIGSFNYAVKRLRANVEQRKRV